ncbi:MAG: LemA family protein [Magnetococcales bacterium]|nr:LemA family protein [Magnetococcales bacterium]
MTGKDRLNLDDLEPGSENSERMRRMKRLMRELYKEEFETKRFRMPPIRAKSLIIYLSFASIVVFGVTTLYNFNRFVNLEERVLSANGHVEDVLQRRVNLFDNLINLTLNQSALEQEVFRHVANVRSNIGRGMNQENSGGVDAGQTAPTAVEASPGASPEAIKAVPSLNGPSQPSLMASGMMTKLAGLPAMAKLLAVVEQYPEIRSSVTYQQLMDKLVEIENRIAKRRDEYNEEVRIYNTLISSFPWYVLARVTGFERYNYFHIGAGLNYGLFKLPDVSTHVFKRLLPPPLDAVQPKEAIVEKPPVSDVKPPTTDTTKIEKQ